MFHTFTNVFRKKVALKEYEVTTLPYGKTTK